MLVPASTSTLACGMRAGEEEVGRSARRKGALRNRPGTGQAVAHIAEGVSVDRLVEDADRVVCTQASREALEARLGVMALPLAHIE